MMENETMLVRPTAGLRWVPKSPMQALDFKLQQHWELITYKDGKPWKQDFEWRDVPIVMDPS